MDVRNILMMVLWLAVVGLIVLVASRLAGRAVNRAGV